MNERWGVYALDSYMGFHILGATRDIYVYICGRATIGTELTNGPKPREGRWGVKGVINKKKTLGRDQ